MGPTVNTHPTDSNLEKAGSGMLSVIIPVYNEAAHLEAVIRRVREVELDRTREIIVVDDGSTDESWQVLRSLRWPDLRLLKHVCNLGKGRAIRTAIPYVNGHLVLIQDADLEYCPPEHPVLLGAMDQTGAAAVYGSRFLGTCENMLVCHRIDNWCLSTLIRMLYWVNTTDEATGYKLFRADVLMAMSLHCERFEFCPEVTARLLRAGNWIVEVPIHYKARTVAEGKKIRWQDCVTAVWTLFRYRFIAKSRSVDSKPRSPWNQIDRATGETPRCS